MKSTIIALPALAALASAATQMVMVGPGNTFSPDTVTAAQGDVVEFHFTNSAHNVVSGPFDSPCQPATEGLIYSNRGNEGDVFSVMINSTDPIWLYCSVQGHCESGMAMVINAPSSGNTLDAYKQAASSATSKTPETGVSGGTFDAQSSASSSSMMPSATMSSGMSATSSGAASATSNAAATVGRSAGVAGGVLAGLVAFFL